MKTCSSARLPTANHIVVTLHHPTLGPNEQDWDENIRALSAANAVETQGFIGQIIFTDGPGPNAKQRQIAAQERKQLYRKPYRGAVITPSSAVRGIVTAFAWLGVEGLKAYAPAQVANALAYLQLTAADKKKLVEVCAMLADQLGGGPVQALSRVLRPDTGGAVGGQWRP